MYQASWLNDEKLLGRAGSLQNVDVQVADVPTLTRAKLMAADLHEAGRTQDVPDLGELLAHQQITTMGQFFNRYGDAVSEGQHNNAVLAVGRLLGPAQELRAQAFVEQFAEPDLDDLDDLYGDDDLDYSEESDDQYGSW